MGFIVPTFEYQDVNSNVITLSNAYVAIAHYDVNLRNYKPEMFPQGPFIPNSNGEPSVQTTMQTGIIPGMSLLVNYGIWESKESRENKDVPLTIRTLQSTFDSSNIYEISYSLVKGCFPDARND